LCRSRQTMSIATPDTKTCYECGLECPIDQFRLRRRGSDARTGRCKRCDAVYMQAYRRRRRDEMLGQFAVQLRQQRSPHRATALAGAMTLRFGGVDGFARAWKDQLDAAAAAGPGSKFVLDSLRAITRLIEVCSRQEPDYSEWSDEDLETELRALLASIADDEVDPS